MKLVVTEIFYSLQGEGPFMGLPSVFIRLGGCIGPLCPWCDTEYAWHEFSEMGTDEIIAEMNLYDCRNVVITGGEPFLQWETGLIDLHEELVRSGYCLSYETSGKVDIPGLVDATIIMSPKNIEGQWHLPLGNIGNAHYFKFVADDAAALGEIDRFVKDHSITKDRVFIMPQGKTRAEQLKRMKIIFSFCREHGYRMTPRLHVLIFDDKRGV
jgi:7-carboxy-7-deazaguanine synthase